MKFKGKSKVDLDKTKRKNILSMDIKDVKNGIVKLFSKANNGQFKKSEKKKTVVAFDIGSTVIKIAVGVYYKEELSIQQCIKVPTPVKAIDDGVIKIRDAIVNCLKEVLKENGIKAKEGICTTNSTSIINREILIPVVSEDEMETVVRYEIQQYLPINLDECIIQTTILDEIRDIDGRNKLNVRVIAYPKKIALEYYKLLTELNLKPYALDVNFNALNKFVNIANVTNELENNVEKAVAFLDIGANFVDVNIYKNGKLDFTRTIKAGTRDLDEILIEDGSFELEQLDNIKEEKIIFTESESRMSFETRLAKSVVDEWTDKIEMILQFYKNSNANNEIDKIFVFGGGSKLHGMSQYMTMKLGMKVRTVKKVHNIAFSHEEYNDESICDYMNVIGSVIRL